MVLFIMVNKNIPAEIAEGNLLKTRKIKELPLKHGI
jgi:hypothetical protein